MARSLYDYVERIFHVLPEALNTWRAQSPDGFLHVTENLLGDAITHLEQQAKNFRGPQIKEDTITAAAIGFFNRYGICASSQTNSRGHVDIFIKHAWQPSLVICGEAKIWKGVTYHIGGLAQVLGYTTGRTPFCFILVYVKTGALEVHMRTLQAECDAQLPEQQQGACANHAKLRWALLTGHQHSSGHLVTALHAGVNLV
jgi:hypothetical protein